MNIWLKLQAGLALALSLGCAVPRLVTVPSGPQPANVRPVRVDFPPPPAKIEEIPLSHGSASPCVWRDGYWDWTGRRWEWHSGRAVVPAQGCSFAEAKLEWTPDSLSFYRPAWYPTGAQTTPGKTCIEIACRPVSHSPTLPP